MANKEHFEILKQGVEAWNEWMRKNPRIQPDLSGVNLVDAKLDGVDLTKTNLHNADLTKAILKDAYLIKAELNHVKFYFADLSRAQLVGAKLDGADFSFANLTNANLQDANATFSEANLYRSKLDGADLRWVRLTKANFYGAALSEVNLYKANLNEADLNWADLTKANLSESDIRMASLFKAKLENANLSGGDFRATDLRKADLRRANLSKADLYNADLSEADLSNADLNGANLKKAYLDKAIFVEANLSNVDFKNAHLVETNFVNANLTGCRIYGISAWNLELQGAKQSDLIITPPEEPLITVDNLEVAQFVYLMLHNEKIRDVINTIGKKGVLILGRFTPPERKAVLKAIKEKLRQKDYVPIVFDFERPNDSDFTETIKTLAGMCRFIIADITNPKSSPLELQATVPDYMIPFIPIIQEGETPFAMFNDLKKYGWVLAPLKYTSEVDLIKVFEKSVIDPAQAMHNQLTAKKAEKLPTRSTRDYM